MRATRRSPAAEDFGVRPPLMPTKLGRGCPKTKRTRELVSLLARPLLLHKSRRLSADLNFGKDDKAIREWPNS
jgi:hypothetical protein